jgi:hypothetical protein
MHFEGVALQACISVLSFPVFTVSKAAPAGSIMPKCACRCNASARPLEERARVVFEIVEAAPSLDGHDTPYFARRLGAAPPTVRVLRCVSTAGRSYYDPRVSDKAMKLVLTSTLKPS